MRIAEVDAIARWVETSAPLAKMWDGLLRFAGLLGSLAEAKTDEEAGAVLQAATATLGSYREFRQGGWVGFLSGYAGMAFAGERGDGVEYGSVFAPLLPVGLELGHKLGRNNSLNLLLSVLDVGAVAATRFGGDQQENMAQEGTIRRSPEQDLAGVLRRWNKADHRSKNRSKNRFANPSLRRRSARPPQPRL